MKPQSISQVIEQIVRITCVALFIKMLLPYGVEFAAAGAMFSVILGEFISLLYMVSQFKRRKRINIRTKFFAYLKSSRKTLSELFSIALPSTASRMIGSVSNFLEPILVAQSLAIAGIGTTAATKQYGELTGYVLPLLFLPTFITHSLAIALVPNIAEADAKRNERLIHYRIHQSIRISFASGALATIILILFANQILTYMYGTANASTLILFMAPFYMFMYIQSPLQAALQALDLAKSAMWNGLIGSIVKFIILFLLASSPAFGIHGVAIAMAIAVVLITLLHLAALKREINFYIPVPDIAKMVILLVCTWVVGSLLKQIYTRMEPNVILFLIMIGSLSFIYILFLFAFRFLTKEELKQIPIIQRWIS